MTIGPVRPLRLECSRDLPEIIRDRQVLRTDFLAFAASDTLGSLSTGTRISLVIGSLNRKAPVERLLFGIEQREILGNGDLLRTARHAIAARRARDGYRATDNPDGLGHDGSLPVRQRLETLHIGRIVQKLLQRRHAAENHHDAVEACRVADGPRRRRKIGPQVAEKPLGLGRNTSQRASLDGLHHHDLFAVTASHLVAHARLNALVVPVEVVDLQLHELRFGVRRQDLVQQFGPVVERKADVANAALGLLAGENGETFEPLGSRIVRAFENMQPIVV